jgi:Transposase DDE domain
MILEELYCQVDDFNQSFMVDWEATLIEEGVCKRSWECQMSASEIMTIMILFHQKNYRTFKHFYTGYVAIFLKQYFPNLLSYTRFVEQKKRVAMPLFFFMMSLSKKETGIYFVDSTTIKVCNIKREKQHKVFEGLAKKSKSTMGWFFGFKLHILINSCGEIMAIKFTESTVDDRPPVIDLTEGLYGKLFADKGYISSKLKEVLFEKGIELITKVKKNMKSQTLNAFDKVLLRKRAVVESVIDQLKNISQIEHSRHRSIPNFLLNLISGLTAYALQPKKPAIDIHFSGLALV